ncbi:hypothetical protein DFJ73DRAFT_506367 [Zopfochytrium polystomum]|nr:hypothetical protein DFJ73DRAFT_506367 [Zopfochytrium polystomum]
MIPQTAPLPSPASHRQQPHPQPQQPQQQQHQRTTRSLSLAFVASVLARRLTARKSRRRAQPATLGSEPQEQSSPIPTSPARGEHSDGRSPHIAWRSMPSLPVRSGTRAESSVLANVTRKWSVHRRRPATTLSVETFDPPSPPRDEVLRPATPTDANPSIVVGLPLSAPTVPTYPNLPSMGGVPIRTEENRSTETTQPGNLLTSAIASLGAPELMANLRPKGHGVWPTHAIQDGSESDTTNNVSASIRNEQSPLSPSEALTTNTAVMTAQHPADICDDTGRVSPSLSLPTSFRHSASSLLSLVMASVDDAHDYPEPLGDPCYRESAETAVDILPAAVGDSSQKVESNRQEWSGFEVGEFMGSQGHIPNVDSSFNKVKTIGGPENAEQIKNKVNVNLSSAGIKMPRDVPLTFAPTHAVTERSQYQSKIIRPHTALSKLDMANRTIFIVSEVTASTLPSATIGEELVPAEIEPENGEGTPGQWSRLSSAFKRKDFIPRNDAMPSRSFRRKGQDRLSISSEPSDSDGRLANWAQRLVRRMSSKKMLGSSRNLASSTFERTEEEDETPYTSDFNLRSPVDESSAGWKRAVGRFHAAFAFASRSHRRASSPLATVDRLPLPQSPPQAELPPRTLRRRSRQYKSLSSLATRDQIPPVVVAMDRKAAKSLQNDMGTPLASIIERKPKQPTSNSTSLSLFLQRTISRRRKHDFAPEPRASVLAGIELVNEGSVGGSRGGTPTTGPALVLVTDSYLAALESARRAVKGTDLKSEATDSEVLPSEHQTTGPSALDAVKLHSSERGGLISIPTEPGMPCHSQEPTVPETAQVFRRIKRVSSAARTSDASRTRSAHVRRRTTNPKAQADDRSTSTGRIAALPIQCHCFDCVQLESDPSDSACELVTISPTSTATKRLESDES